MSSPQFQKRTHSAQEFLKNMSASYNWIFQACDKARKREPKTEPHIFAKINDIYKYMYEDMNLELYQILKEKNDAELSAIISGGLMLSAWRMTQGIYRFDDEIYQAVISTDNSGDLPVDILKRLPEWSVYIETPDLTCEFDEIKPLLGFWATFGVSNHRNVLLLHANFEKMEQVPYGFAIDLTYPNIESAIKAILIENQRYSEDNVRKMAWVYPAINLLLYLCADREITNKGKIIEPENPQPKKTKKGWKLFPANKLKIWDVGVRMGAAIRSAKSQQQKNEKGEDTGRTVRPHIRRAHWKNIVSGKMKDEHGNLIPSHERKHDLRWLPPIAVNLNDVGKLPAVIHKVKK